MMCSPAAARLRVTRPLLLCVLLLAAGVLAAAQGMADLRRDYRTLTDYRDALARTLTQRQAGDRTAPGAGDYLLRLDEGADRDELQLTLRRRANAWAAAYAVVPGWEQSTMKEWRGFFLSNGISTDWRPSVRYAVDAAPLATTGDRLTGEMTVQYRYDQLMQEKLPPGEMGVWVDWWSKFIPTGNNLPRTQRYQVDAQVMKDVYRFEVLLDGGIQWPVPGPNGTPAPNRRPMLVQFQAPGTRFTPVTAQTPTWNGGWHEGDTTGLRFADGHLTGTLVVLVHQDGWTPWGGGKCWQHAPQVVKYEIDARLRENRLTGTYVASGDMGTFNGAIRGTGGRAVLGFYKGSGEVGAQAGPISGMMLETVAPAIPAEAPLPADDATAVTQVAARVNAVVQQIRALHLALEQYPLPLADALQQCDVAMPVWGDTPDAAQLAAYCRAVAAALPAPGAPKFAATREALNLPTLGAQATVLNDGGANILPQDASGWSFVKQWQVLGPFEQRVGLEHDAADEPEIVPLAGLTYGQATDHLGCLKTDTPKAWQTVTCTSQCLAAPWDKGGWFTAFAGQVWYATAVVNSPVAREYWFSLETGDQGKLWVNDKLVWTDAEKIYRNRAWGPVMVSVPLQAGTNRLLLRVHRDRRESWVRLAITGGDIQQQPLTPEPVDNAARFVFADATPPLAWDIDTGTNVAWRRPEIGGGSRPAVLGDAVLVTMAPHTLLCLDGKTGETRWTAEANILSLTDPQAAAAWSAANPAGQLKLLQGMAKDLGFSPRNLSEISVSEPVTDGQRIYIHAGTGVVGCFDAQGKSLWLQRTQMTRGKLYLYKDRVLVEGLPGSTWTFPQEMEPLRKEKGAAFTGVLALDAATGAEQGRWTIPVGYDEQAGRLIVAKANGLESAALLTGNSRLIEFLTDRPAVSLDAHLPGPDDATYHVSQQIIGSKPGRPFGVSANSSTLFMTAQEEGVGVRFWPMPGGRLAYKHLWNSNYEQAAFGSFQGPCVATEDCVFTFHPVINRAPHSPDPREEINCLDARTGRHVARLKSAIASGVNHYVNPVIAGRYLYVVDAGGGSHGGNPTYSQVTIVTADARLQVVGRNLLDLGSSQPPVFVGDRMYVRSPKGLVCIAVTTPEGRAYQAKRQAAVLLEELGPRPALPAARDITPATLPIDPTIPVGKLMDGRATEFWLGAGPFPAATDAAALAALQPRAGTQVTFGGKTQVFTMLSHDSAYNDPPLYRRQGQLQGTGDIIPFFYTWLNPSVCANADGGVGLFYTVLENTRDRIVLPAMQAEGVTQWLGGRQLQANEPLHLVPGRYPYLVRVEPAFFKARAAQPAPTDALPQGVIPPPYPDFRLAPAFKEVPHPATRFAQWRERAGARLDRLQAVVNGLPGSEEATTARAILTEAQGR